MFERRLYHHLDWLLLSAVLALSVIGLLMIYSTTYDAVTGTIGGPFYRQVLALVLGLVALAVCLAVDYRALADHALLLYGALIAALLLVGVVGVTMGGAQRWIPLGPVHLQPSEFVRPVLALTLAAFLAEGHGARFSRADWVVTAGVTAVPFILIARQPDLGTAIGLVPVALGISYVAGLRLRLLAALVVVGVLLAPVAWTYALEDYQRARLSTFLDPERDPRGVGYQQIQARITVGSGGLAGKGFLQGTQGQYKFLPVAHTDFIFSVLAEEQGFMGVLTVLALYLFVIFRGFEAARLSRDRLGAYLVVGLVSGLAFQVMYNIAMSAGLAPVKGLPLPLMSYGGSSMIATLAIMGLVLNVRMRRFTN